MAQHDTFSNDPSRSSSLGETGLPPTLGASGGGRGVDSPTYEEWRSRPSSTSRQRNQWRQYKHMTPDFGRSTPDPEPPAPAPREAALPSFNRTAHPAPGVSESPLAQGVTPPRFPQPPAPIYPREALGTPPSDPPPLSLHPHSLPPETEAVGPAPSRSAPSQPREPIASPANVTPLRPRERRRSPGAVPGSPSPDLARTGRLIQNLRRFSPQPRLAKLPLPALYALRLAILGVGVAAIVGTLLAILSPSNVASKGGEASATALPTGGTTPRPRAGQGATTITALQPTEDLARLKAQLEQLATLTPGLLPSLYAFDIDSGRYVDLDGTEAVASASTIKVPILVAFLQQVDAGNLALNQAFALQSHHLAGGSGTLANEPLGREYTALDLATRMIIYSDNTATNMMIEALGGQEALNEQFATWGLEATVLHNPLPDLEGTNTISARDLALLMALVDQGDLLSRRSQARLISIMQRTENRRLIASGVTDGSLVANKTGDIAMALGDVALVDTPNGNRYVLAVMVKRPNNDGRASQLIRRITETVHQEFNQPMAPAGRPSTAGDPTAPDASNPPEAGLSPDGSPLNPTGEPSRGSDGSLEAPREVTPADSDSPSADPRGNQIPPG